MRQKSDKKLNQIIEAAGHLFCEQGFECTSMSKIASLVGGSKATLYNYFSSKDKIFVEVLLQSAHKLSGNMFDVFEQDLPIKEKVEIFSRNYLAFMLSRQMIDIRRTLASELHKVSGNQEIYENCIKKKWKSLSSAFALAMEKGEMRKGDPWRAAMQLKGLLETDLVDRRLLGVDGRDEKAPCQKMIHDAVGEATELFWTYYAPADHLASE